MIIAISNQKGGVGKSTTTVNLAAANGILRVDVDPHAGLTKSLGFDPEELEHSSFHATTEDEIQPAKLLEPLDLTKLS